MTVSSVTAVQPVARARVKSTSSLQHQPVIAQHIVIPPPASVPSSRRSTSSLSSTPPTPSAVDALMPACPTGWARFDLSPLNEVTQDTSSTAVHQSAVEESPAQTSSDADHRSDESQPHDFARFPSPSVQDDQPATATEGQMSNDKFSDSFLSSRDGASFDDPKPGDSVVASSSFELMSPSSDKDSVSLPSPEAPPPPLPADVVTSESPSEPPIPPPRPRAYANSQVGHSVDGGAVPVTPSSSRSESVHSSPVPPPATVTTVACQSPAVKPPPTVSRTSGIDDHSQHITSSGRKSRFTVVQPSSGQLAVNNASQFPVTLPADDVAPPPLPPRNVPVSSDAQKQHLMRGTSVPASGKIHSFDDVPPPPPPRRSLSKPVTTGSQPVDPFAPIPATTTPVLSVPARQQTVAAAAVPPTSTSLVVETTIAPLPRPRPHLHQTQNAVGDAVSGSNVATSSGSSSPWHSVNTPPILEPIPVDPFSNVDPFAGSVSPDDPFAEPSLDGMLSDFDTDTLSMTAFRTRAVTIDSASSDVYDASAAASVSAHHRETGSLLNESHSSSAANVSPVVQQNVQTPNTEAVGTGCLVDLNTTDDADNAKWQPFSDKLISSAGSQALSGFAPYADLRDVWDSSEGVVDWKLSGVSSQSSDITTVVLDSSEGNTAVEQPDSSLVAQVSDTQHVVNLLDISPPGVSVCQPGDRSVMTDMQTSHCNSLSLSVTSSSCTADRHDTTHLNDGSSRSARAKSEPPVLSQSASSIEHRNSSFDAVFGDFSECFPSSPVVSAAASGVSVVTVSSAADTAVSTSVCSSDISTTVSAESTMNNMQLDSNTTTLPATDAQVTR